MHSHACDGELLIYKCSVPGETLTWEWNTSVGDGRTSFSQMDNVDSLTLKEPTTAFLLCKQEMCNLTSILIVDISGSNKTANITCSSSINSTSISTPISGKLLT